jgi:trimethylamine--corrinoid protein Co-methyltransferase
MVSSLEHLLIDVEIFRYARQAHRGVATQQEKWLTDVIAEVGPGGNYLTRPSTLSSIRSDEWFLSGLGAHESYENWRAGRKGEFSDELREKVDEILATHEPLPLDEEVEKELDRIHQAAKDES